MKEGGVGFGKRPPPQAAQPGSPPPTDRFEVWAMAAGAKRLENIAIGAGAGGERGVLAVADVARGARILSVPARLALQVTTMEKAPSWCSASAWSEARWDARLAMKLLHEADGPEPSLQPWLLQLPRQVTAPVLWDDQAAAFEAIAYPSLGRTVRSQRELWDAARAHAPGPPSAERWDWAMGIVRSRAFSGPYAGGTPFPFSGTFVGALIQLFAAATLAIFYTLLSGNDDLALDGFLAVAVYVGLTDLVFSPRASKARRYVLCPWVDFLNHDGALENSEVAYEYFADSFAVRLDWEAGDVEAGKEVKISYGARSNDVLLQYYGFVQRDNPHDTYSQSGEHFCHVARSK